MALPGNPYDSAPIWPLFLTAEGRKTLLGMFGYRPKQEEPEQPVIQFCTCPIDTCPGLVARGDRCSQCDIQFATAIICPACGWKQGVLNADHFDFKCWNCHARVADK